MAITLQNLKEITEAFMASKAAHDAVLDQPGMERMRCRAIMSDDAVTVASALATYLKQLELGAKYKELVGYDPFEDDPSIDVAEVEQTLKEYAEEAASQED